MALKIPLALYNGETKQLQPGDAINVPSTGSNNIPLVNDNGTAAVIGCPVYSSAAGHFNKANANAAATSNVIGLVAEASIANGASGQVATDGVLTLTTTQWDAVVTGGSGGLTFNVDYYLDVNTGKLCTAAASFIASNTAGNYLVFIGRALSTTDLEMDIARRILY